MDEIAKLLLDPQATGENLGSVEHIVKAYPQAKTSIDNYEKDENSAWSMKKVMPAKLDELKYRAGLL